jgi:hypothetical protein
MKNVKAQFGDRKSKKVPNRNLRNEKSISQIKNLVESLTSRLD